MDNVVGVAILPCVAMLKYRRAFSETSNKKFHALPSYSSCTTQGVTVPSLSASTGWSLRLCLSSKERILVVDEKTRPRREGIKSPERRFSVFVLEVFFLSLRHCVGEDKIPLVGSHCTQCNCIQAEEWHADM